MLSLRHFSLEMPVISCAKVRHFSTKSKQNGELFALTVPFLMLVNLSRRESLFIQGNNRNFVAVI